LVNLIRHRRWRPEQDGVVNDEAEFRLHRARISLLPEIRVLGLQPEALERSFSRAVLQPDIKFSTIGNRRVDGWVNGVPTLGVPGTSAESGKSEVLCEERGRALI
jgi:hypothetical protein